MPELLLYLKQLAAHSRKRLYSVLSGMVMISLLDGIGILLVLPMLSLGGIIDMPVGFLSVLNSNRLLTDIPKEWLLTLILGSFVLIVAGQNALQRLLMLRNTKLQQSFTTGLRISLYGSILQASWDLHLKKRRSDLIHSIIGDFSQVSSGVYLSLQLLASLVFTCIQIGLAMWLSVKLTVLILVCGIVLVFLSRKYIKRSKMLGGKSSELAKGYLAGITDQLNGIKEIKSNALEPSRMAWVQSISQQMNEEQLAYIQLKSSSQFVYKISSAVFISVLIMLFFNMFQGQQGELILIIIIFSRLWPKFTGIQSSLEKIASAVPPLQSLLELQRECEEYKELGDMGSSIARKDHNKRISILDKIELRDVYYRYDKKEPTYALQQINIQIPSNRMTAIVGRSGAGKSTLIDLVMGLLQPEQGTVLLDEVPLTSHYIQEWRTSISYVPQDPFLFNASIRENLLMMESEANEDMIWGMLETASAAEFVRNLPMGLDTIIGDRGVRLSGGERQRLVLARALLRRPSILILDEATSALDTENEKRIQEAIYRMKGTMTIIVIAHRLSTIRNADQIIVLDQGKVVQTGRYGQLEAEKKGLFSSLLGQM